MADDDLAEIAAALKRAQRVKIQTAYWARKKAKASPEEREAMLVKSRAYTNACYQRNIEKSRLQAYARLQKRLMLRGHEMREARRAYMTDEKRARANEQKRIRWAAKRLAQPLKPRVPWNKGTLDLVRKKQKVAEWRLANPDYSRKRYRTDPVNAIVSLLRSRFAKIMMRCGVTAKPHTLALIGCTGHELHVYLEARFQPGMTWENRGKEWHIDHIKQCCSFDLTKPDQQAECFHFTNLRPLWKLENLCRPRPRYRAPAEATAPPFPPSAGL